MSPEAKEELDKLGFSQDQLDFLKKWIEVALFDLVTEAIVPRATGVAIMDRSNLDSLVEDATHRIASHSLLVALLDHRKRREQAEAKNKDPNSN